MIPILGFAPDADPSTPGVLTEVQNLIPTEYGMRGAPAPVDIGVDALAAECRGAAYVRTLAGARSLFAGTTAGLYRLNGTAWDDLSKVGGYTLGAEDRWSIAQFADATLAATISEPVQRSISGGAFAGVSGSPNARIVVSAAGFAVALNTSSSADQWYCSAYLDDTDWTLDVTTQCVAGRLVDAPGAITAAKPLGNDVVAYKESAIFVGTYAGPPAVWQFARVSGDIGCVGVDAIAETPQGHVFVGRDNVYLFDGAVPRPLATGAVRRWLFNEMSGDRRDLCKLMWDRENHLVWIFYPGAGSSECDRCVVYHMLTQRWGVADQTAEAVVPYVTSSITYDGGTPLVTDYDTGPAIPFDSPLWMAGREAPALFDTTHTMKALAGSCSSAYFVTGDFGDDQGMSLCDSLRVHYSEAPLTSTCIGLIKDTSGVTLAFKPVQSVNDGRHDVRQRGRWHRFRLDTTGNFQVTAVRPSIKAAGRR